LQEQNSSSWIEGAAKKTARFQSLSGDTVAAGYDTLVKILDVTTERELRTIGDAHDKPINAITWSPNVSDVIYELLVVQELIVIVSIRVISLSRSRTMLSKCGTRQTTTLNISKRRNCHVNFKHVFIQMSKSILALIVTDTKLTLA
jgi:WD40 repeat protein